MVSRSGMIGGLWAESPGAQEIGTRGLSWAKPPSGSGSDVQSTMLTELLAFLDELLSYLESVRDVRGEDGRPARRSPEIERLTQKTRALRDAVSVERQKA
jgi:hypothetical protein